MTIIFGKQYTASEAQRIVNQLIEEGEVTTIEEAHAMTRVLQRGVAKPEEVK